MNNKMARTVRDKAGQLARRALRARDKDIQKKLDFWRLVSGIMSVLIVVLIGLVVVL